MTCHLVGNRQMITVGGAGTAAINKECDWERKSVAIYDLSALIWGSVFTHDAAPYEVPPKITSRIGGVYVHLSHFLSRAPHANVLIEELVAQQASSRLADSPTGTLLISSLRANPRPRTELPVIPHPGQIPAQAQVPQPLLLQRAAARVRLLGVLLAVLLG